MDILVIVVGHPTRNVLTTQLIGLLEDGPKRTLKWVVGYKLSATYSCPPSLANKDKKKEKAVKDKT